VLRPNSPAPIGRSGARAKGSVCQLGAVYAQVRIQNSAAEVAHHLVVNRLARKHEIVRDPVGLDQTRAQSDENLANHRFARCDAAGKADFQQAASRGKTFTTQAQRHRENREKKKRVFLCVSVPLW